MKEESLGGDVTERSETIQRPGYKRRFQPEKRERDEPLEDGDEFGEKRRRGANGDVGPSFTKKELIGNYTHKVDLQCKYQTKFQDGVAQSESSEDYLGESGVVAHGSMLLTREEEIAA